MHTAKSASLDALRFAHGFTTSIVKDWPADKWTAQPSGLTNHAIWTIGHLAVTMPFFAAVAGTTISPLPESYGPLFSAGSKPTANSGEYPPAAEVLAAYKRATEDFIAAIEKLSEADLAQPSPKADGGFAIIKLDAVARASWHEAWHTGQLVLTRKALGLPSLF